MDRQSKEDQDRRLILPQTPCANMTGAALLDCLYTTDAKTLDEALPESYQLFDTLYDYPTSHKGLGSRVSTLVYVDGVTVSFPLEEALQRGLNDVPFLLQSMQAEMDCAPAKDLENLTVGGLQKFIHEKFSPIYGAQATEQIEVSFHCCVFFQFVQMFFAQFMSWQSVLKLTVCQDMGQ